MNSRASPRRHRLLEWFFDDSGQGLILPALLLPLLLGAAALAVDVGAAYAASARLQSAVDAGALAGATALSNGQSATTEASMIVSQNDPSASHITVSCSGGACTAGNGQIVTVSAESTVAGGFATLFGQKVFTPGATAAAKGAPPPAFQYAVFQGNTQAGQSLDLSGSPTVNGNAHSNDAITMSGAVAINGVGTAAGVFTLSGNATCTEGCISNSSVLPMPVWTPAQLESRPGTTVVGSASQPVTCSLAGGPSEVLDCGSTSYPIEPSQTYNFVVYGDISMSGDTTINGCLVAVGGNINISGNTQVYASNNGLVIAAFTSNGTTGGTGGDITMSGGGSEAGVLYAPDGTVSLSGTINALSGAVVANTISMSGTDTIDYQASMASTLPQMQAVLVPPS